MKHITKEYTVWKQFWSEPKYIARDMIILLAIYGAARLCMDVWSLIV
jgi:hypothetical protein